jgi:pyruvate/2-oxoacid:ferredoxin oxidoreductase beta subunit
MKSRLGTLKAITATAHKLARLIDSMLKHGTAYVAQGLETYEQQYRERLVKTLSRKARELGYELVKPVETTSATSRA